MITRCAVQFPLPCGRAATTLVGLHVEPLPHAPWTLVEKVSALCVEHHDEYRELDPLGQSRFAAERGIEVVGLRSV